MPSANLTGVDWYYLGQNFWFQDFILMGENKEFSKEELEFQEYLNLYMKYTLNMDYQTKPFFKNLGIKLSDYDFSNTCVDLVGTISGKFVNEKLDFGVGRIKKLVEKYNKERKENKNEKIVYQCSSIGSLKENFTNDFIGAFLSKIDKKISSDKLEIIFPSTDYVNSIEQGNDLASCLFLGKDMYEKDFFPKKCFKVLELLDKSSIFKSNLIFHSKFILLLGKNNEVTEDSFFYFGSHNFSPSAWGNFQKQYTQLSSANYELGVIFNPRKLSLSEKRDIFDSLVIKINSKHFQKDELPYMQNSNFFS